MYFSWQTIFRSWHRTVVLFSVALLIIWNFASIFHQVDLTPEHHTHHHCQLFAGAQHGLAKAQPAIPVPSYTRADYDDVSERSHHVEEVFSAARAPPYFA
ncbi:hypothetical protein BTR40_10485 [Vibrio parahaemolyticus]|uniref:DUF2607 domain-containing protein n=1 Tax=Vibrio parahaemolyticus TaxID=670 RepID=UPI000A36A27A|nr:DUF2607 domain-containing protein [Vibrio parahaemolyticus]OUJ36326.1 hypothetical protein BTR40_10485 [Vibrio parahaemolyticus]